MTWTDSIKAQVEINQIKTVEFKLLMYSRNTEVRNSFVLFFSRPNSDCVMINKTPYLNS